MRIGDWISEGVNMIKDQVWAWALVTFLFFLVSTLGVMTCLGIFLLPGLLFFGPHIVAMKQLRGGRVEAGDLFSGFGLLLPGLGYWAILSLLALPSMLLFGLPLFFLMPLWFFVPHLVADRGLPLLEAMKQSQRAVLAPGRYWWFVLFQFVLSFLANLGTYACYVGLLFTFPLLFTTAAVAYRDIFGMEGACSFRTEDLRRRDGHGRARGDEANAYY